MATTQDIAELKAQFDERVGHLRESFGVVEGDINRLGQIVQGLAFTSLDEHQQDDNEVRKLGDEVKAGADDFVAGLDHEEQALVQAMQHLAQAVTEAQGKLDSHVEHHGEAHGVLHDATQVFTGNVEAVVGEAEQARNDYLSHVQEMHGSLSALAEKVFGSAAHVDESVRETQSQALEQAATAFHGLMDGHLQGHLPEGFEHAVSQLTGQVHSLGEHALAAGQKTQQELQQLISDVVAFAKQEVHDKIEQKFEKLMHDVVAWLAEHITQSIVVTTTGVAVTGAMSPLLPEMIILKKALDGIKEAIKIFKALEEIF
jgi:hypothetical protein